MFFRDYCVIILGSIFGLINDEFFVYCLWIINVNVSFVIVIMYLVI